MHRVAALAKLLKPNPPAKQLNWVTVESGLGISLPLDYKEFWSHFSTGCIGFTGLDEQLFVLHSPYSDDPYLGFPACVSTMSDANRNLREEFPEIMTHRVWPEHSGLIGFAHDSNGVDYFLHSSNWHVHAVGDGVHEDYGCRFSEFIWRLAHNDILIAPAFQGAPGSPDLTIWTE